MDLKDLVVSLRNDHDEIRKQKEPEANLEALRMRLEETPEAVTEAASLVCTLTQFGK